MSSMRNAVSRRAFKERAQPKEREKFGLLEKHKDYSLRAKDFKEKTKKLQALKLKATDRNPDEFSFKMMSTQTRGGIKIADRGNKVMPLDVVRLLKTQDSAYVRTMLLRTRRQIERIETGSGAVVIKGEISRGTEEVRPVGLDEGARAQHVLFVDHDEEKKQFDLAEWERRSRTSQRQLAKGTAGGATPGPDEASDNDTNSDSDDDQPTETAKIPHYDIIRAAKREKEAQSKKKKMQRKRTRAQQGLASKLQALKTQSETLAAAEQELDLQRARMSKSATVGGVTKKGVKFRVKQRKR